MVFGTQAGCLCYVDTSRMHGFQDTSRMLVLRIGRTRDYRTQARCLCYGLARCGGDVRLPVGVLVEGRGGSIVD